MGTWGPGLYQDDIAHDVKEEYIDLLKSGRESDVITQELIDRNSEIINDKDEAPVFWFSLADVQWQYGRLSTEVKEKALQYLNLGNNLQRWQQENPGLAGKRKDVLDRLQIKLCSTQPKLKRISSPRLYHCEWKLYDVYAFLLESDFAKSNNIYHHYALLQKIDENLWHPGHIIPIVRLKVTQDMMLPKELHDIDELEYLPTGGIKGNFHNKYDYQLEMISKSRRVIPKKLIYLGNFPNMEKPANEEPVQDKISIRACHWVDFEELIVKLYNHYKRNLSWS